jgi:hypothetical protein
MAQIIEFHIPVGFNRITKYVPPQERGALIVFPPNLAGSASDASALNSEMIQEIMERALFIWPPQELSQSMGSAFTCIE